MRGKIPWTRENDKMHWNEEKKLNEDYLVIKTLKGRVLNEGIGERKIMITLSKYFSFTPLEFVRDFDGIYNEGTYNKFLYDSGKFKKLKHLKVSVFFGVI